MNKTENKPAPATPAPEPAKAAPSAIDVTPEMESLKTLVSADLVKSMNGVYSFVISDATPSEWYLDLKNGSGNLASGAFDGKVNCTLTMNSEIFKKLVSGNMKASNAFMMGKLKIKGDMGLAMKLEKLMGSLKAKIGTEPAPAAPATPKVTPAAVQEPSKAAPAAASEPPKVGNDVTPEMESLKKLVSADLVKSVNGVYSFVISDATPSEWYLDLKSGSGNLASGAFDGKINCTLTMNSDIFKKLVSGNMKASNAFMMGKLKIKGDMGLAMKLEKLMGSLKAKI